MLKSAREMRCMKKIDPSEPAVTHVYNLEKVKAEIATGSFDQLCKIVKQQLLYASYCNKRIPYDPTYCFDETAPLQQENNQEREKIRAQGLYLILQLKNWKHLYYYFLYRKLLQEAYQEGNDLIDCVHTFVEALHKYLTHKTQTAEAIQSFRAQVKSYHEQLTKKQVCALKCYELLHSASKNTVIVEHMHTLHAIAQTWFLLFDIYQDIVTDLPESSTWDITLAPYYKKCFEELYFLDSRQGRHDLIRDEMLTAVSLDSFIGENVLIVAYHHLENAMQGIDHPFLIVQEYEDDVEKKLPFIWKECVLVIAQYLKNIGYCSYGPSVIERPTIKDLRKALMIHAEIFAAHVRDGAFSYKLSPQHCQQLSVIQMLHDLKPIPNPYSLILPSRNHTRTKSSAHPQGNLK